MALVMLEGFDFATQGGAGTTAALQAKGWSLGLLAAGRLGATAMQLKSIAPTGSSKTLPSTYTTLVAGFAFFSNAVANGANNWFAFQTNAGANCGMLRMDGAAHIIVVNSGGTTIATGTTALTVNTWYYIEFKLFVNTGTPASGTCEVHLNGAVEIASTAGNFGSTAMGQVALANANGTDTRFDDLYVLETSTTPNNDFLGDSRIDTLFPNGAGTHTQFSPLSGSNWSNVSDSSGTYPDGDTTYNFDTNTGDIDTFTTAGTDSASTVYGVQTGLYARKDDAALRQIAPLIRQGGVDYPGTTVSLGTTYQYYTQLYNQDPTPANWTAGNVNADEFGYKLIA